MIETKITIKKTYMVIKISQAVTDEWTAIMDSMTKQAKIYKKMPKVAIFDLKEASFINTQGIISIISLYDRLYLLGKKVAFVSTPNKIKNKFLMLGLDTFLRFYDDITQALEALGQSQELEVTHLRATSYITITGPLIIAAKKLLEKISPCIKNKSKIYIDARSAVINQEGLLELLKLCNYTQGEIYLNLSEDDTTLAKRMCLNLFMEIL